MSWMEKEIENIRNQSGNRSDFEEELWQREKDQIERIREGARQQALKEEQRMNAPVELFKQVGISELLAQFNEGYFHIGKLSEEVNDDSIRHLRIPSVGLCYKYPVIKEIVTPIEDMEHRRSISTEHSWKSESEIGFEPRILGTETIYVREIEQEGIEFTYQPSTTRLNFDYNNRGGQSRYSDSTFSPSVILVNGFSEILVTNNLTLDESEINKLRNEVQKEIAKYWVNRFEETGITPEDDYQRKFHEYEQRKHLLEQPKKTNIRGGNKKRWWQS